VHVLARNDCGGRHGWRRLRRLDARRRDRRRLQHRRSGRWHRGRGRLGKLRREGRLWSSASVLLACALATALLMTVAPAASPASATFAALAMPLFALLAARLTFASARPLRCRRLVALVTLVLLLRRLGPAEIRSPISLSLLFGPPARSVAIAIPVAPPLMPRLLLRSVGPRPGSALLLRLAFRLALTLALRTLVPAAAGSALRLRRPGGFDSGRGGFGLGDGLALE